MTGLNCLTVLGQRASNVAEVKVQSSPVFYAGPATSVFLGKLNAVDLGLSRTHSFISFSTIVCDVGNGFGLYALFGAPLASDHVAV